jgi:hypothetical protein
VAGRGFWRGGVMLFRHVNLPVFPPASKARRTKGSQGVWLPQESCGNFAALAL